MPDLIIEAGKFYRTRDCRKVIVYEVIPKTGKMVGAFVYGNERCATCWLTDGRRCADDTSHIDIVATWSDPPVVDWDKFPEHIVAVAMDLSGCWWVFTSPKIKQDEAGGCWISDEKEKYHFFLLMEKGDRPAFSGDWRDSLAVRPGWEGK